MSYSEYFVSSKNKRNAARKIQSHHFFITLFKNLYATNSPRDPDVSFKFFLASVSEMSLVWLRKWIATLGEKRRGERRCEMRWIVSYFRDLVWKANIFEVFNCKGFLINWQRIRTTWNENVYSYLMHNIFCRNHIYYALPHFFCCSQPYYISRLHHGSINLKICYIYRCSPSDLIKSINQPHYIIQLSATKYKAFPENIKHAS